MLDLTGKKVLVTGAGRGIGKAVAKKMLERGAIVGITSYEEKSLIDCKAEFGENAVVIGAYDLSKEEEVLKLAKDAEEKLDGVDILVNNAGITKDGLGIRMKNEDWKAVLNVNLDAVFYLSRDIGAKMLRRRFGRIINISSVVGAMGNVGQANYSASKGAVVSLTKTLAREYATRGVTVNAVSPGFIESDMTDVLSDKVKEMMVANIPLGKMGSQEDIANAILFLASDESAYITGQNLHVNGGMLMV